MPRVGQRAGRRCPARASRLPNLSKLCQRTTGCVVAGRAAGVRRCACPRAHKRGVLCVHGCVCCCVCLCAWGRFIRACAVSGRGASARSRNLQTRTPPPPPPPPALPLPHRRHLKTMRLQTAFSVCEGWTHLLWRRADYSACARGATARKRGAWEAGIVCPAHAAVARSGGAAAQTGTTLLFTSAAMAPALAAPTPTRSRRRDTRRQRGRRPVATSYRYQYSRPRVRYRARQMRIFGCCLPVRIHPRRTRTAAQVRRLSRGEARRSRRTALIASCPLT